MADLLIDSPETLSMLYGESFYIFPEDALSPVVADAPQAAVETPHVKQEAVTKTPEPPKTKLEPVKEAVPQKPGITWKTKPASKVLFVLQLAEFKNPELTDLLKKIVDSLGISTEFVGFGQIDGPVLLEEFDQMPNPHAVVFDADIWGGKENPVKLGKGEVFFTQCLAKLQNDQDLKRALWVHLKKLKDRLL